MPRKQVQKKQKKNEIKTFKTKSLTLAKQIFATKNSSLTGVKTLKKTSCFSKVWYTIANEFIFKIKRKKTQIPKY